MRVTISRRRPSWSRRPRSTRGSPIAVLPFGGARLTDRQAVRLLVAVLAVLHLATAVAEVYASALGGVSPLIWANVAVRVVVAALFLGIGLRSAGRHP